MLFDWGWHTFIISSTCYYVFTMVQVLSNDCILFLNDVHVHTHQPTYMETWTDEFFNKEFFDDKKIDMKVIYYPH